MGTWQLLAEDSQVAAVHGYTVAFYVSAGVFAFGTLVVALVMRSVRVAHPAGQPAAAHA